MRRPGGPPPPPRVGLIQRELDRFDGPRYLEIGLGVGAVFFHVYARRRVGVDPRGLSARKRLFHPLSSLRSSIVRATSDAYFASLDPSAAFEVCFVDGYHTYAQALCDVENSLLHLAEGGVVMMHDCNPPDEASGLADPHVAAAAGSDLWCGDVWKAVVHLRATRPDLETSVLDTDYGIGVVRRGNSEPLALDVAEIEDMGYADLERNRAELLGLQRPTG